MGQILTSIAEALSEDRNNTHDPLPLLAEAVELFGRCLESQMRKFDAQSQHAQGLQVADQLQQQAIPEQQWANSCSIIVFYFNLIPLTSLSR